MVGITFTGVGLLDGTPADDRALITRVAHKEGPPSMKHKRFREVAGSGITDPDRLSDAFASHLDELLEENSDPEVRELVKQSTGDYTAMAGELLTEAAKKPFKDDLVKENEQLKKQVEDLTKQLDEIRKAEKAKARAEAANEVLDLMKKSGRTFEDEAAEKAELERLQSLSEETLSELKGSLTTMKAAAEIVDDTKGVTRTNGAQRPKLQPDEQPGGIGELRGTIRDGLQSSYARYKATDVDDDSEGKE
jgi:paraquat-inducible protein B